MGEMNMMDFFLNLSRGVKSVLNKFGGYKTAGIFIFSIISGLVPGKRRGVWLCFFIIFILPSRKVTFPGKTRKSDRPLICTGFFIKPHYVHLSGATGPILHNPAVEEILRIGEEGGKIGDFGKTGKIEKIWEISGEMNMMVPQWWCIGSEWRVRIGRRGSIGAR